jgi:hypothetical protein
VAVYYEREIVAHRRIDVLVDDRVIVENDAVAHSRALKILRDRPAARPG